MRLFEAIIDANHRAVAGDTEAGLHPADFARELPVIALTCIDPRLNVFFPNVLALPAEQFIWLRNAGNIIFDPMSSMTRTLALACAVKGGREIAIIGHSDCLVCKTNALQLLEKFKDLGVDRHLLPDNLNEFFGLFSSERQNVIKGCDIVRHSPLIGPKIPVHGLLLDIETGRLDWVVNGYETWQKAPLAGNAMMASGPIAGGLSSLGAFNIGVMKFPEGKIGDQAAKTRDGLPRKAEKVEPTLPGTPGTKPDTAKQVVDYAQKHWPKPPRITAPPPILPHPNFPAKKR